MSRHVYLTGLTTGLILGAGALGLVFAALVGSPLAIAASTFLVAVGLYLLVDECRDLPDA